MADRVVENYTSEIPPMPEALQRVLMQALDDGREKLAADQDIIPFTLLVAGGNLFTELHPGDTPAQCYASASHTVEGARGASAYAFCYDGYIETNEGEKDAIIAEGGAPGLETGYAIGLVYEFGSDEKPNFSSNPAYIGPAPNFMKDLTVEATEDVAEE